MPESIALASGDVVAGRYRVARAIGQGGMAVVYQAEHVGTGRPCALKVMLPAIAREPKLAQAFLAEARVTGKLATHPHVVEVLDVGVDAERELAFIAMELLEGQTLASWARVQAELGPALVCALLRQLASALEAAHAAGIVHRDLKPGNVFVTQGRDGRPAVKVLDFGIAKVLDPGSEGTATRVGTPSYCAPEQLGAMVRELAAERGISIARGVCAATDVWALGFIVLELLTGAQPCDYWEVETLAEMAFRVALAPRDPPRRKLGESAAWLPAAFDDWFIRCIAHDAAARFQSAAEAVSELESLLDEAGLLETATLPARPRPARALPAPAPGPSPPEQGSRPSPGGGGADSQWERPRPPPLLPGSRRLTRPCSSRPTRRRLAEARTAAPAPPLARRPGPRLATRREPGTWPACAARVLARSRAWHLP
ncbi:MAG: serine/threonine protein kinase [Deltaproteobacteria bacterium]|nr:serine/threonine protein kinase [Deltaproteobacteria bacterium]